MAHGFEVVSMEKKRLLLKAAARNQIGSLLGVWLLLLLVALSAFSALALYTSGERFVSAEMDRLGFGDVTIWVNGNEDALKTQLEALPDTRQVAIQPLIFTGYEAGGTFSDNEGQLIVYDGSVPYRFLNAEGDAVQSATIAPGTVTISHGMRAGFDVNLGDTIRFELSRTGGTYDLTVAGYFEDAFMGSSMIDMKSFLISQSDWDAMRSVIATAADYDVLGHTGAMLHIFQREDSAMSASAFRQSLHSETDISAYTAFTYGKGSILSYMLMLQNILTGFLMTFSAVLLIICLIVMSHSLSAAMAQNIRQMAVMKTIGLTSGTIRGLYFILYGGCACMALIAGAAPSWSLARLLARGMLTSTGLLIEVRFPWGLAALTLLAVLLLLLALLHGHTARVMDVTPMQALNKSEEGRAIHAPLHKRWVCFFMARREVLAAKGRYAGVMMIAALLVIFLSIVGTMGAWLGPNGEGLMNAFSVAEHDIGVQPFNDRVDMDAIEEVIEAYSPIRKQYALAMQSVTLNGQAYTANILDDPAWFHVLEGSVCDRNGILITYTVARELGLSVGDAVQVAGGGRKAEYTVSGIYQCANGMGANIGLTREGYARLGDVSGYIWCHHYLLEDGSARDALMKELQTTVRGIDVHTNSWSGLSGIVAVMRLLLALLYVASAVFILVAVFLTAGRLLQAETGSMAIYKSLGFPSVKLRLAFALRFLLTVAVGALLGIGLSQLFADRIIGQIFRLFGIGAFSSTFGFLGNLLPPLAVITLFFGFAWLFSHKIKRVSLVKLINENDE